MPEKFDVDAAKKRLSNQIKHGLEKLPFKLLIESSLIAASFVGSYYKNNDGLAERQIVVMETFSDELNKRLQRLERLLLQNA